MTDFRNAARMLRQRADLLENMADYCEPLALIAIDDGGYGNDFHDPNLDVLATIQSLRDMARQLDALDYNFEGYMQEAQAYIDTFRDIDAERADEAECGFYDSMAWREECAMLD